MNELKPVLAIETSGNICGVSVYYNDDKHFDIHINNKLNHSKKLFQSIDSALKMSDTALDELQLIAVSGGPGSFTGLRIGLSAAKGIALGAGLPIVIVPTFQAIAFQTASFYLNGENFVIANKVNNDEFYFAEFSINENSFIFAEDLRIIKKEELLSICNNKKNIISNSTDFKNIYSRLSVPAPLYIAKWSKLFGNDKSTYDFDTLEPLYYKEFIPIRR